ncbi:hypothetical protein [Halomonas salipaludis]|nr:hypothetical protein [Halomonas salipaludis]
MAVQVLTEYIIKKYDALKEDRRRINSGKRVVPVTSGVSKQ